ncbi:TOBE domain-containing protein [Hoyosella sp. YIM 151337]|uniref:TOBE domain-containing protein n=1 Tax=Hoyosella sp. YIM 151337 TaxID=2992742 RepID=UPI002236988B|nr:TOBE domain-containing protein [Hoyosella sp. YIM 151337]MCW4355908.1 TOBE domain-containing protein [Hoyosella sp. YIM 151337]
MPHFRLSEAAEILGVSDDTVRRWVSQDLLTSHADDAGRQVIDGAQIAAFARARASSGSGGERVSARNRISGIVTEVLMDGLMAQVEVTAGRFRLTSLMSREAAVEMGLEPGVAATVVIKATTAIIEREGPR